jgi:hypothetical protein
MLRIFSSRGQAPKETQMSRFTRSLWSTVVFSALAIVATETAGEAGTKVRVDFHGADAQGKTFVGWFEYDQSQPKNSAGAFLFGSGFRHEIDYQISGQWEVYALGGDSDPFLITTSENGARLFKVEAQAPVGTKVTITLPTNVRLSQLSLPLCMAGSTQVFQSSPPSGSSAFSLNVAGTITFSGNITSVSCSQPAAAPVPVEYPPAPYPVYACEPSTSPVYVCQPRRACFLSGLFASRCHRSRCW